MVLPQRTYPPRHPLSLLLLLLVVVLLAGAPTVHTVGAGERVLSRVDNGVICYKGRALPNLFLIGAQKCGTTTLNAYLGSPEFGKGVVMKYKKELHFADLPSVPRTTPEWLAAYSERYPTCTDPRITDETVRYVMDATPAYIRTLSAALQIGQHYAHHGLTLGLKFIVSLRDPVDRTLSYFGHIGRYNIPCDVLFDDWAKGAVNRTRTCMAALQNLPKQRIYQKCHPSALLDSWYAVQLAPWWRLFPPQKQFLILDFVKLVTDRDATIMRVLNYLGIDYDDPLPKVVLHENETANKKLCEGYPLPTMSDETRAMLAEFFQPLNAQLPPLFERYGVTEWLPTFVTGEGVTGAMDADD